MRVLRTSVASFARVPESWMLGRLHVERRDDHEIADADRRAIIDVVGDRDRYAAFLARVYGFEAPLEAALLMTSGLDHWLDLRDRGHLRLLRADLQALGVRELNKLPRCPTISPFGHPAEALGWVYVVERNMLLHGADVRSRLGDAARVGYAYLQRRSSGQRIRELGSVMDRVAQQAGCIDRIIGAAKAAFRVQHEWYVVAQQQCQHVA